MDFSRLVKKLPNYVSRFGWPGGLRLLLQIEREFPKNSQRVKAYRLPTQTAPVYLREALADHAIFWQCLVQQQYDISRFPQNERLTRAYRTAVEKGVRPLVIDGGGNIGLTATWLAMTFPQAAVYTIEPDVDNFEILKKNTASFSQIEPVFGAIWNENGKLRITNPKSGFASFRVTANDGGVSPDLIPAYTVRDLCRLAGVEHPFIVKLDIEGAQSSLFKSNTEWVAHTHAILLELDDWLMPWEGTSRSFFTCLSQYAFDYLIHGETIFCFRDFEASS